jgi:hypothetical protein
VFIPPGCVLLPAAVDRLAEARRTAGQANDDGTHAAQVELRGEFYNDTISPLVVSRSGKKYKIRPHHWGSEKAPTWFEQDEFWLIEHEYLVDPPLGMFHGKELAYIFVGERDLQRLMAKQEVKQEAAPPPGPYEVGEKDEGGKPLQPEGASEAAPPKKRGRKKGDGSYTAIDLPLLDEMKGLISSNQAASPEEAARKLAKKAHGSGSEESKAERLAKRYRRERA